MGGQKSTASSGRTEHCSKLSRITAGGKQAVLTVRDSRQGFFFFFYETSIFATFTFLPK